MAIENQSMMIISMMVLSKMYLFTKRAARVLVIGPFWACSCIHHGDDPMLGHSTSGQAHKPFIDSFFNFYAINGKAHIYKCWLHTCQTSFVDVISLMWAAQMRSNNSSMPRLYALCSMPRQVAQLTRSSMWLWREYSWRSFFCFLDTEMVLHLPGLNNMHQQSSHISRLFR